ncbi:ArsR/SmtB family transcription factor [Rouxiella sp. Mn2063]|uniref:ArsR/SmtB family transcription factor n=1 Tax=Rouxiella sp. Mn2063 TaxID=3395262 RepID=UPI003BD3191F
MSLEESLATLAAAIADRTRARMLCLLMDGRAYTATEITAAVDVVASTGSSHLAKLQEQNLITCVKQGRYRYFRLSGQEVAHLLETLMGFAGVEKPQVKSSTPKSLQFARTCYDHMAGDVAVKLHDCFFARGWLNGDVDYVLTDVGRKGFNELGVDITPPLSRRQFACSCLDWSERKSHLGGALGAALLVSFEKQAWVQRRLDSRELVFTARGKRALLRHFQLHLS